MLKIKINSFSISWFKSLARNLRDGGFKSFREFLIESRIFSLFKKLVAGFPEEPHEVHVLVGRGRLAMAFWMMGSLIAARRSIPRFVLHDDGSMGSKEADLLKAMLPSSRLIRCVDADALVLPQLQEFPLLAQYRKKHIFGKRLTDFPMFCADEYVISIDTDILFFSNPEAVFRCGGYGGGKSIFMKDVADTSLVKAAEFEILYGKPLASPVNAGLFSIPRKILDFPQMEKVLRDFHLLAMPQGEWYVEQTVLAALASLNGGAELLPASYELTLDSPIRENAVSRHYVGAVRHLFYSEGIPKVRSGLNRLKL